LVATASGSSVTLTWNAPSSGGAVASYIIDAGTSPGASNLAVVDTGNTLTTLAASGVGPGTYYVRVRARNAFGSSVASNEVSLVVAAARNSRQLY
jgi:hypothetical protein